VTLEDIPATVLTFDEIPATIPISVPSLATVVTFDEIPATVFTLATFVPTVFTLEIAPATVLTLAIELATVVTSVAFGTNLWKLYVCNVDVVSTINPKPSCITEGTLLIVIVALSPTFPSAIVTVPPLGVWELNVVLTDIRVPAPLFTSGFALGKLVSLFIGTKPPTSSTKSIILASIAAVVATLLSVLLQVSPDWISPKVSLP